MRDQVEKVMVSLALDQIVSEDEENVRLVNEAMKEVVNHPDCTKMTFYAQKNSERPAYSFKSPEERELYRIER